MAASFCSSRFAQLRLRPSSALRAGEVVRPITLRSSARLDDPKAHHQLGTET